MARALRIRATLAVQQNTSQGNAFRTLRAKAKETKEARTNIRLAIANGVTCTQGHRNHSGTRGGQGKAKEEKQEESHRSKAKDSNLPTQEPPIRRETRWSI